MKTDAELLRAWVHEHSQAAFAELVGRHLDFVYATALRLTFGHSALARDVAQLVFIDLARKAPAVARHPVLAGWLHTSTRYTAAKALRAESRRRRREQQASTMADSDRGEPARGWAEIQPLLDDLLGQLKPRERDALLLRFFHERSHAQIGAQLALSETAARSCVDRALDRLNALLARRGITSTSAALATVLASHPAVAAPAGLSAAIAAAAAGSTAAASPLALLLMSKVKIGATAALLAAVALPLAFEFQTNRALSAELATARAATAPSAAAIPAAPTAPATAADSDAAELLRLQKRLAVLKARPAGVVDAAFKSASQWRNVGRSTPASTWETQLWAAANHDLDVFAATMGYRPADLARMHDWFGRLGPGVRAQYGTPERYFAHLWIGLVGSDSPPAWQPVGEHTELDSGVVILNTWTRDANGNERAGGQSFAQVADGWVVMPARPVADKFWQSLLAHLDPATGDFAPGGWEAFRREQQSPAK